MKFLLTLLLFLCVSAFAYSREPEKVELWRLDQFEKANWQAFSFGEESSQGDYYTIDRQIVVQRLPDGKIILSYIQNGQHDLPVAKRYLSPEEAERIRMTIASFHRQALVEESNQERVDRQDNKTRLKQMNQFFPDGYTYTVMVMRITKSEGETIRLGKNFDENKKTQKDYEAYFNSLLKAK
ncbi:MAG: hypothetical protein PHD76_14315 [Methylacidiphilales bacterium]|nr:hypothetical protein [Candidatus Methylacidiphilales bacterium]